MRRLLILGLKPRPWLVPSNHLKLNIHQMIQRHATRHPSGSGGGGAAWR
jgi:hypothetical protein